MKYFFEFIGIFILIVLVSGGLSWFDNAADVAKKEFYPDVMLKKYEWFINQANNIKKMDQDVINFRKKATDVETTYAAYGNPKEWSIDIRVQYNKAKTNASDDLMAMISQRNGLVQEYNAQSAKFTWAPFESRRDMPSKTFEEYRE